MSRDRIARLLRAGAQSWYVRDVVVPFAATRIMLALVAVTALSLLPRKPGPGLWDPSSDSWLMPWARWDSGWYFSIIREGYWYRPGEESNVAFFPLYPLLVRIVGFLTAQGVWEGAVVSGILVSNLALLVGLGYLVALVRLDFSQETAARTAIYLLVFPTSFFFSAVYTESLFFALSVASFYYARRQRWWVAGLLGFACALTRPQGVLLTLPLAVEYLTQRRFRPSAFRVDILALGLTPAGLLAYVAYLQVRFNEPLAFLLAQQAWGRETVWPWDSILAHLSGPLAVHAPRHSLLDLAFTAAFIALGAAAWRFVRPSYALFASVLLLVSMSTGTLMAVMRYGVVAFPLFMVLALAGKSYWFDRAYLFIATGLLNLFMVLFALWYWVA